MDLSDDFINDFDVDDFDVEPPEEKNRLPLIVAGVVIILLCCCCVFLWAGWTYGDLLLENLGLI